jgi:hypothetical protein
VWAKEEEFDDQLPDIESISGDESDTPVAKKRKTCSTGTKHKGRKGKKSGARTYSNKMST